MLTKIEFILTYLYYMKYLTYSAEIKYGFRHHQYHISCIQRSSVRLVCLLLSYHVQLWKVVRHKFRRFSELTFKHNLYPGNPHSLESHDIYQRLSSDPEYLEHLVGTHRIHWNFHNASVSV